MRSLAAPRLSSIGAVEEKLLAAVREHDVDVIAITGAPPFALCLAGHTHGGQVRPGFTVWTPPGSGRFVAGAYETAAGPAYVSRGIGTSVLAARLLAPPELPMFRLVRA